MDDHMTSNETNKEAALRHAMRVNSGMKEGMGFSSSNSTPIPRKASHVLSSSKISVVKPTGVVKRGHIMRAGRMLVKGVKQISPRHGPTKRARVGSNGTSPEKKMEAKESIRSKTSMMEGEGLGGSFQMI